MNRSIITNALNNVPRPAIAGVLGALLAALVPATSATNAEPTAPASASFTRQDLQRHDLSIPGREVIQTVVSIAPGTTAPRHSHPGEEIVYVLTGTLVYEVEGQPPKTLRKGDVLFVPAGVVHTARNIGSDTGSELATYIVDKSRPLLALAE